MSDLISREEVLNLIDTAFENGAFDGRYAYENLIDAVQNLIHPLETDLISRQAVIDRINKLIEVEKKQGTDDWGYGLERVNAYEAMLHMVENEYLYPSVEPERKPGKWIRTIDPDVNAWTGGHTCSECGRACVQMSMNFCANCGAKMEVNG